jgi:signal transduction histidine kinase
MDSSILTNIDLLTVGTVIAATFVLGFTTYFSDSKNKTNLIFLLLATVTGLWGVFNYFGYKILDQDLALLFLRLTMFLAVWQAYFIFRLFYLFPLGKSDLKIFKQSLLYLITIFTSLATLTPYVFNHIAETYSGGRISKIANGPLIPLFGLVSIGFVISGIVIMIKKTWQAKPEDRQPYSLILFGTIATFSFIITFNFLFPAFFDNSKLIPFGALFTFPLIIMTSYAFSRGVLNVKVLSTSILVFFLSIITFFEVLFTKDFYLLILRGIIFATILGFGLLLIKSVMKEVSQREKIEKLAVDLERSNTELEVANEKLKELDKQKTEFVSIASHQLRSPLTAIKGYSSMLLEGSFGKITGKSREAVQVVFESSQKLVGVIEDFLNITRIELGKMKYEMTTIDMGHMVESVVNELKPNVMRRGLTMTFTGAEGPYNIFADAGKLNQVFLNVIDNAIKYTEKGSIAVAVARRQEGGKNLIRFTSTDTGVGMDQATIPKLFEKFVRATGAGAINITGTGLGLYVAKQIVEAHGGKIWAESAGKGKGSQFIVEMEEKKG